MSVKINLKPVSEEQKWKSINNGDFIVIETNQKHPIDSGLYRVFTILPEESMSNPNFDPTPNFILIPMFGGPFPNGLFPYMLTELPFPNITRVISKINIEVE